MVVASGQSSRQVIRTAEKLIERLKSRKHGVLHIEGLANGDWVIVDTGEVIVHLFRPEVRSFYNIEKIWGPAGYKTSLASGFKSDFTNGPSPGTGKPAQL